MRFGPWSLRAKITFALIAATALSIGSTAYFSIRQSYEALNRQAEEEALVLATALAEPVNEMLDRTRYTVTRLAGKPHIVGMERDRQRDVLDLMTGAIELLDGIVISAPDGRVLLTDKSGRATESLLPPRPGALLSAPVAAGGVMLSDAYRSTSGAICIAIGAPIRRRGAVVGVLSGIIALERHSVGGMKGIRIGRSGYAYLVDSRGRTLSHPDPARLFEGVSDYRPSPALEKAPGTFDWINTEGEARLAALAPIAGSDWYVVVTRLRSEAEGPARRLLALLLANLAAGLAIAVLLGAVLARWITKPIAGLMRGVRELSAGRIAPPIEPGPGDEIGQLTLAFNDMAARLTRTIRHLEAFGYSVVHDLRAPARAITVLSELILRKEGSLDEETRRHFRRVLEAGKRLRLMLDGLMTLSRLAQETISPEEVDLAALARECEAEIAARHPARRLDLTVAGGMTTRGDRRLLRTLLRQLLANAWTFAHGRVEVGRRERPGAAPAYFVRDDGPGFDPALAERMFKPFHRLPNARELPGIGIGLSASARIVELHGGTIWAESRPGEGASVFFTLEAPR